MNESALKAIPVLPRLLWKRALECKHFTIDLPLDAEWIVQPAGDCADKWQAYKRHYEINVDDLRWVPLNGIYDTVLDAQDAVKLFLSTKQPVFLDKNGDIAKKDIPSG